MKGRELYMRCFKARLVSWLNSTRIGAIAQDIEGNSYVAAVYDNGRYVDTTGMSVVRIPDSPRDLWGPDGPVGNYNGGEEQEQQPEAEAPEQHEGDDNDGTESGEAPGD